MSETGFLIPVAILLGTSVLLSALISILKIKIIPNFVLEIIIGIVLGVVLKDYLADQKFTTITDGLYVVGFALIMFLSGFDADLDIIKDKEHTSA
ncbi:MAG TPA: cation:proton antiporter, partial [Bacilli bacterium]